MHGLRRSTILLVALLVTVLVAACGRPTTRPPGVAAAAATPSPTSGSTASPVPVPLVSVAPELQGTWTAVVTGTTATSGDWTLKGTASDLRLRNPSAAEADDFSLQPIAITPTTMTFAADSGCPDQATVTDGSYTWSITGDRLVIKLVSDSCGDRAATLATTFWTRAP